MTDSPLLEEVFAAVLAEHVTDFSGCECGWQLGDGPRYGGERRAHVAERLAARFEQVQHGSATKLGKSWYATAGTPNGMGDDDRVPVFRLVGGDQ